MTDEPETTTTTEEPAAPSGQVFDATYVDGLRREAAKYRAERNALADQVKAYNAEKMTREEQAAAKLAEVEEREKLLTARTRAANLRAALMTASAGRLASVDAAIKLMDTAAIEYDADDNPVGVDAAMSELLKTYPFLAGQTPATGDKTNPERSGRNSLTLEDVKKLSPDEINARWPEVSALMSSK